MSKTEATSIITGQYFFLFMSARAQGKELGVLMAEMENPVTSQDQRLYMRAQMEECVDVFVENLRKGYPLQDDLHNRVLEHMDAVADQTRMVIMVGSK